MHRSHLGDTNDLAKRPFMEMLAPIDRWVVVPMLEGPWEPEEIVAYRNIVGAQLSTEDVLTAATRGEVLSTVGYDQHAFFDPTTGVSLPTAANPFTNKHICVDELAREVDQRPNKLTISYNQSRNRNLGLQAEREAMLQQFEVNGIAALLYVAQASYLILSQDEVVIAQACQNLLGAGIPESRIIR